MIGSRRIDEDFGSIHQFNDKIKQLLLSCMSHCCPPFLSFFISYPTFNAKGTVPEKYVDFETKVLSAQKHANVT